MENTRTMADVLADLNARIALGNTHITNGTYTLDFAAGYAELEKEYAKLASEAVYDELAKEPKPLIAAIKRYSFTVKKHKEVKDEETKKTISIEIEDKERQIDLLRFCKRAKLDHDWEHNVAAFNQSLCLRGATELGYSPVEIKELARTYYMQKLARELKMGKAPVGNGALCKMLQDVIDSYLPPEDETKGNAYKCNNHDIRYLLMCYTKKGRSALSVAVAKDAFLRSLIMDIMHRIIEGKLYNIEYRPAKNENMLTRVGMKKEPEVDPSDLFDEDVFADLESDNIAA